MSTFCCIGDLSDNAAMKRLLMAAGLSDSASQSKAPLFARCAQALAAMGHAKIAKAKCLYVPGRIEVLGKHTDYAGGRSILATPERGFCLAVVPRNDGVVRMVAAATGKMEEFSFDPNLNVTIGTWANYPMTVVRRLARNFAAPLHGADIAFDSDLPPAAGMSSSSALLTASYLVLAEVNNLSARAEYKQNIRSKETLAEYLGTIENGQSFGTLTGDKGVGTFGGSEDHTAILCCQAGRLSQYSYCPVRPETAPQLPAGFAFAIGSSGVVAEKTGSAMHKYNRVSRLARLVLEAWNKSTGRTDPHLAAAIQGGNGAIMQMRGILASAACDEATPDELLERFEQFYAENEEIIPTAGKALAAGDVATFGMMVDRSQDLTERQLKNQVPETVFLARTARELGAHAASAFGAGFGGSVWTIVKEADGPKMLAAWSSAYAKAFPASAKNAVFFITHPGPASTWL